MNFLLIKSFKINRKFIICFFILLIILIPIIIFVSFANDDKKEDENNFIKWVDFNVTSDVMKLTSKLDIDSHNDNNSNIQYNWIELISYLACKYGNDFNNFKKSDLDNLVNELNSGKTMEEITRNFKNYNYYYEAYSSVLCDFIGNCSTENNNENTTKSTNTNRNENNNKTETGIIPEKSYGIKVYLPIAKNYAFSHYKDFGKSRDYGFKRVHLGNDLMGSIGTPIVAMEGGTVEHLGWNQYGGWRIGIRSFDKKRYYYYAHLRKDHPYADGLEEGSTVRAGDTIGYLGMTGYSIKENVNNVNVPHLHFGIQLIFDESQVDSPNEIWIDVYEIIEFLK